VKVLLTQPLTIYIPHPPMIPDLGLGYIATALLQHGHIVEVMDWNMVPSVEHYKDALRRFAPDVVGIKVFTKDVFAAIKTTELIKEVLPEARIILGGPHPSAADPSELMNDFALCDVALRGEVETTLPLLLAAMTVPRDQAMKGVLSDERAATVPGLVWRTGGSVRANAIALRDNLDDIPFPAWDLIKPLPGRASLSAPGKKRGATAPIVTTRGCPGKCSFCTAYNVNGRKIRYRSPANVLEEMVLLHEKHGVDNFMICDNCFTSNKNHLIELCEMIVSRGMNIEWDCTSYENIANLTNETLSLMHRAGCRLIHMGIESGSLATRKTMNKSCRLQDISEKVKLAQRNGIMVAGYFMLGFPGETKEEMKTSIAYAFSLGADRFDFTPCFPLPGTEVYRYLQAKFRIDRIEWSRFDINTSPYPLSALPTPELTLLVRWTRYRARLAKILRRIIRKVRPVSA